MSAFLKQSPAGFTLYEINSRPWLHELGLKSLADVPDAAVKTIADNGVHMIWLQGVWKLGRNGLELDMSEPSRMGAYKEAVPDFVIEDVIGSPYAVVEYEVTDELGGDKALKAFREQAKKFGMRLMLDFVPNHMAVDSVWAEDPDKIDYFIRKAGDVKFPQDYMPNGIAHGKDPYCGAWPDTAQLNYWNPALREAMLKNLTKVASQCDGIRCDMAMIILNCKVDEIWGDTLRAGGWKRPETDFWEDAIPKMRAQYPDTVMMAEVYWGLDPELFRQGFDATYDKTLYDILRERHMDNLRNYLASKPVSFLSHSTHFVENHDEPRAAAHFGSRTVSRAAAAISFLIPGLRLQFHGQWDGFKNTLDVHLRRAASEPSDPASGDFYKALNAILASPTLQRGAWEHASVHHVEGKDWDSWRAVAWRWRYEKTRMLVVVNYSEERCGGHLRVPDAPGSGEVELVERISGEKYMRDAAGLADEGLHCILEPWQVQVFEYTV